MDANDLTAKIEKCAKKTNTIAKNIIDIGQTILEYECDSPVETKEMLEQGRSLVHDYCSYVEQISLHEIAMAKFKKEHDLTKNDDLEKDMIEYEKILQTECNKLNKATKPLLLQNYDNIASSFENNANDSEIIATQSSEQYIDPITKKPIERPVRNKNCNHLYEESIMKTIIKKNPRTKCPIVGCGNHKYVTLSDLCLDEDLLIQLSETRNNKDNS